MPVEKLRLYQRGQAGLLPENYDINEIQISSQTKPVRVLDCLDAFLASLKKVLLVDGAALTGKTSLCHWLQAHVGLDYQQGHWLPIYIPLSIQNPSKTLIEDALRCRGLTEKEILAARELPLLLILDGYDELGETQNLYVTQQLHRWSQTRIIITSRSLYLINQPLRHLLFTPFYHEQALTHLLESIELVPLSQQQIQVKIEQALISRDIEPVSIAYRQLQWWIAQHPQLAHTLVSPLFLDSFIQRLSHVHAKEPIDTHRLLQQTFISCWIDYHQHKPLPVPNTPQPNPSSLDLLTYMTLLARHMQNGNIALNLLVRDLFEPMQDDTSVELFDWDNQTTRMCFAQCPIHIIDDHIALLHESLTQNLLTDTPSSHLPNQVLAPYLPKVSVPKNHLAHTQQSKIHPFNTIQHSMVTHILTQSILSGDENSEIHLRRYLRFLYASRNNPDMGPASANAISILVAAEYDFSNMDLSHLDLAGANLNGIKAKRVNFQHTVLDNCSVIGADFEEAQFQHASMDNITWGELDILPWHHGNIAGLCFINNNQKIMVWNNEHGYDTYETSMSLTKKENDRTQPYRWSLNKYNLHSEKIVATLCSSNGELFISSNENKIITLFKLGGHVDIFNPGKHHYLYKRIYAIAFMPDEREIIFAPELINGNYQLYRQNLFNRSKSEEFPRNIGIQGQGQVQQIVYVNDTLVALAVITQMKTYMIRIYDLLSKRMLQQLPGYRLCVSMQYLQMAIASYNANYNNMIRIYRLPDMTLLHTIHHAHKPNIKPEVARPIQRMDWNFARQLTLLLSKKYASYEKIFSEKQSSANDSSLAITALQYLPQHRRALLCSAGVDGYIHIWHVDAKPTALLSILAHTTPVATITFSRDGLVMASATDSQSSYFRGDHVRLFDLDVLLTHKSNSAPYSSNLGTHSTTQTIMATPKKASGINLARALLNDVRGLSPRDRKLLKALGVAGLPDESQLYQLLRQGQANLENASLIPWRALEKNCYPNAIDFFSRAILLASTCADAYLGRGLAYKKMDMNTAAEDDFTNAIQWGNNIQKRHALYERARLYLLTRRYNLALEDLTEASYIPYFFNELPTNEDIVHALELAQKLVSISQHIEQIKHVDVDRYPSLLGEWLDSNVDFSRGSRLHNMPEKLVEAIEKPSFYQFKRFILEQLEQGIYLSNDLYSYFFVLFIKQLIIILPIQWVILDVYEKPQDFPFYLSDEETKVFESLKRSEEAYCSAALLIHIAKYSHIELNTEAIEIFQVYQSFSKRASRSFYMDDLIKNFEKSVRSIKKNKIYCHNCYSYFKPTYIDGQEMPVTHCNDFNDGMSKKLETALSKMVERVRKHEEEKPEEKVIELDTRLSRQAFKWMTSQTANNRPPAIKHNTQPQYNMHKKGHHGFRHR